MSEKKVIAVVGATGSQGGGLVRAILDDPDGGFTVRALTRNTTSVKAQELVKLGAEVVQADNYDEQSLTAAFAGAYGAYLVTDFWAHMSAEKELQEATNLVNAA
ncbi:NmrA-like family protein, partial [Actinoplanes lutulentus]